MISSTLQHLDHETLVSILERTDPETKAKASCTCRTLRQAADQSWQETDYFAIAPPRSKRLRVPHRPVGPGDANTWRVLTGELAATRRASINNTPLSWAKDQRAATDPVWALQILALKAHLFPEKPNIWLQYADALRRAGRSQEADVFARLYSDYWKLYRAADEGNDAMMKELLAAGVPFEDDTYNSIERVNKHPRILNVLIPKWSNEDMYLLLKAFTYGNDRVTNAFLQHPWFQTCGDTVRWELFLAAAIVPPWGPNTHYVRPASATAKVRAFLAACTPTQRLAIGRGAPRAGSHHDSVWLIDVLYNQGEENERLRIYLPVWIDAGGDVNKLHFLPSEIVRDALARSQD